MIAPLLRQRMFRRFWIGQSVSLFGDQITVFAIPLIAVLLLHAGPAQMGLLTAAGILPSLVLSIPAGVWVDRSDNRRRTMLVADVVRAALLLSVPAAYLVGLLGMAQLYAVGIAVGVCDVFFWVAYQTLFVSTVPPESYVEGQALLNGSRAMSQVTGQGLAGVLVAAVTAPGAIVVDALSFLASAIALGSIHPTEPPGEQAKRGNLLAGARFIRESRIVRAALGATATVNYFTFAFQAIFVLYAVRELHVHPATLGLVLGVGAIGAVVGSAVTGRISRRIGPGRSFAVSCLIFPAPLALVPLAGLAHGYVLACLFLAEFLSGLGVMILDISIGAIFAEQIPHRMRARVSGAYRMVNYGIRPLGAVTGGVLAAHLGLAPTLWIAVAGACTCGVWLLGSPLLARSLPPAPAENGLTRQRQEALV